MSISTVDPTHPLLACLAHLHDGLKTVRDVQPVFLTTAEKAEALRQLVTVGSELAELRMRTIAAAGDVAEDHGARDVAAWLAHETRTDVRGARVEQHLATALDSRWTRVAAGLADGAVNPDQARVIVTALEDLPTDLDPALIGSAEETLVGYAAEFGPADLRRLGQRILDVIAPEIADAELGKTPRAGRGQGAGPGLGPTEATRRRADPDHHHPRRRRGRTAQDVSRSVRLTPRLHRLNHRQRDRHQRRHDRRSR